MLKLNQLSGIAVGRMLRVDVLRGQHLALDLWVRVLLVGVDGPRVRGLGFNGTHGQIVEHRSVR